MSGIHVYRASDQPATRYVIYTYDDGRNVWSRNPGNRLLWTHCCNQRRPAKNLRVQVYYDGLYVWCKRGKGCKHGEDRK